MVRLAHVALTALVGCTGCLGYKDSARIVDPVLHKEGDEFRRSRSRGGFKLGPYAIAKRKLTRRSVTPTEELELELSLHGPERSHWTTRCDARRARTQSADYGAVLDESRDAVAISCDLVDANGATWRFEAEGTLNFNIGGTLAPVDASIHGGALKVEILMWRKRFNRIRRHLPQPIAQVRLGDAAIAAMVLSRPEQAWLAADATPEFREVSLATMAALNLLPLGLEG